MNSATTSNSYATGNVYATFEIAGGLVGCGGGTITNSYSTGNVYAGRWAGGFAGDIAYMTIINSYATGNVTANGAAGGGFGRLDANNTVTDFYTTGTVTSSTGIAGPLVGELQYGGNNITNTFWNGSSQGNPAGQTDTAGSLPGHANYNNSQGLTTTQMNDVQYYMNGTINQVLAVRAAEAAYAAQQEANFEADGQQTGGQASFSGQESNSTGQGLNNQISSFTPSNTGTVNGTMDNHIVYSDSGSYSATIKSINADGMQFDLEGGAPDGANVPGGTNK